MLFIILLLIVVFTVLQLFVCFLSFRGNKTLTWRMEARKAIYKYCEYNYIDYNNVDVYMKNFNETWLKFWTFGKYEMIKPESLETIKPYFE